VWLAPRVGTGGLGVGGTPVDEKPVSHTRGGFFVCDSAIAGARWRSLPGDAVLRQPAAAACCRRARIRDALLEELVQHRREPVAGDRDAALGRRVGGLLVVVARHGMLGE